MYRMTRHSTCTKWAHYSQKLNLFSVYKMTRHSTFTKWALYSPKLNPFSVYKMTSHRQRLTMAVFSILDFAECAKISNLPVIAMMTASLEVFQVSSSFTASQFRCPICSRRGGISGQIATRTAFL